MRRSDNRFPVLVLAAVLGLWPTTGRTEAKAARVGTEGWVFIDEGLSNALVDEPAHHFHGAREALLKRDPATAALELRKAAAYTKIESSRAVGVARPALEKAVAEAERLASALAAGKTVTPDQLNAAVARAHQALAEHHYLKASQFRTRGETGKVWHDLQAATVHLENALAWAGEKVPASEESAAEQARKLGERAKHGASWTEDEVGRAIEALGLEIEKLGTQLGQEKR